MLINQRDIDGELAVALHEFLGAVQRINQPVAPPARALSKGHGRRFLGQDWDLRGQGTQAGHDQFMRGQIGGRQWTVIILGADAERRGVNVQNPRAGPGGQYPHRFQPVHPLVRVTHQAAPGPDRTRRQKKGAIVADCPPARTHFACLRPASP